MCRGSQESRGRNRCRSQYQSGVSRVHHKQITMVGRSLGLTDISAVVAHVSATIVQVRHAKVGTWHKDIPAYTRNESFSECSRFNGGRVGRVITSLARRCSLAWIHLLSHRAALPVLVLTLGGLSGYVRQCFGMRSHRTMVQFMEWSAFQ